MTRKARYPLEYVKDLTVSLAHIPDFLRGRRIVDGHPVAEVIADAKADLNDIRQTVGVPDTWSVLQVVPTVSDTAVVEVGAVDSVPEALLKLARSTAAGAGLVTQAGVSHELRDGGGDGRCTDLGDWKTLVPEVLAQGESRSGPYLLESRLPGVALTRTSNTQAWTPAISNALDVIIKLHEATGSLVTVDETVLAGWTEPSLEALAGLPSTVLRRNRSGLIENLRRRLRAELEGRTVWAGRTHGDFGCGNVLVDPVSGDVKGIIDWDRSQACRPAFVDGLQLALDAYTLSSGSHYGQVVRDVCRGEMPASPEFALFGDFVKRYEGDFVGVPAMALLTWLYHVESNIEKSSRYSSHRLWVYRTVEVVLSNLA